MRCHATSRTFKDLYEQLVVDKTKVMSYKAVTKDPGAQIIYCGVLSGLWLCRVEETTAKSMKSGALDHGVQM